MRYYFLKVY